MIITDLTYLTSFCERDENRIKKYVKLYIESIPSFKEKVKAGAEGKDLTEVALQVHAFKPKWMMMGMKGTNNLAIKIDRLCKENNSDVFGHLDELMAQTDKSVEELKDKC